MFTWNHRVVHSRDGGEEVFEVMEVTYDGNKPTGCNAPFAYGNTLEELKTVLEQMRAACEQPVLEEGDF